MALTREEFLQSSGLRMEVLELWIEQEWLIPAQTPSGLLFHEIDIARARLIGELQSGIGANEAGIDVILHLVDQVHGLRRALAELRQEMSRRDI